METRRTIPQTDFAHRLNADGTAASICLHCFATVACLPGETNLGRPEAAHSCWQREDAALGIEHGRKSN